MANARVIVKRRKAVRNIRKITKVMQMIASSRYQKAYRRAMGTKPFVRKMAELLASTVRALQASGKDIQHPLMMAPPPGLKKTALLVITSNRGLCGGYNGNVQRLAAQTYRALVAEGDSSELYVAGKKGIAYVRFLGYATAGTYSQIGDTPRYAEIEPLAEQFMQQYMEGKISGLKIVYTRFLSAGQQKAVVQDVLPLANLAADSAAATADKTAAPVSYDFIPGPEELLKDLIPRTVKIALFQAFVEAVVSEQIARMVAMKAATDNAEKLGKKLTQDYNRARQNQITSALSELMGGVEALK